uniref:DUF1640 domain-containing protein n=1 Tax=Candidatus Kentrum eta TaxID=2126337 RepID=A0A450UZM5_9GAMM|nr:MAG: hypothetical protein BECKH772A_GA0070896_101066 [Candidatus Kentron sp. H]VFJ97981.1 MAG: hypothetical protein BECKH772B_GA0070898_101235 [Candidatus Kentron sp. H]VFK03120.1 MAG: hypothetical protein BECKH772C_GA0070978_101145 [Candidatus Kentron sp. H]
MTAIPFDGLTFVQTLKEGGFDEAQAKSLAKVFKEAQHEADVATKADVGRLEHAVKADIARLEQLIAQTAAETRAEIIKWVSGIALAQVFLLSGILAKLIF